MTEQDQIAELTAKVATLTTVLAMTKTILAETQIDATQAEMTLREELATAKREAVEAYVTEVKVRLDIGAHDATSGFHLWIGDVVAALDAELTKVRGQ